MLSPRSLSILQVALFVAISILGFVLYKMCVQKAKAPSASLAAPVPVQMCAPANIVSVSSTSSTVETDCKV